jgi:alkylation response protein AidB-like acyl-CoA dehydrogenase
MDFALQPRTAPGKRFVTLAAWHAADFASRAAAHDREGSFPFENVEAMGTSGVMAACVPEEFGGLGLTSLHDLVIGINRLGRGDSSTAIAANMHICRPWWITRSWQAALAAGASQAAERTADRLRQVGSGTLVMCALLSESGTDLLHPLVEATRTAGGWLLNGRKIFGTMSPAAQLLEVSCRVRDPQRGLRWAMAAVPPETPGVENQQNWDALGMRGSGSHDVVFRDCFVPEASLTDVGPWGQWTERFLTGNMVVTMGLLGAFLGVAEAAQSMVIDLLTTRCRQPSGRLLAERAAMQHAIAENEIDLAACRAMLERTTTTADAFFAAHAAGEVPLDPCHAVMKDVQCTKWLLGRKSVDIVDRALTLSGGAGYLNSHPLSRLYRDVRAGPFMQPFSPNEAFEYIGKVTLGLDPGHQD